MSQHLGSADYVVVALYLVGTMALGLYLGKNLRSGKDYFLAGRRLPWWAIGMSLVATDIGGTDIIGAGGAAYQHGMAVANFEWIGCIPAMIVAAFIFVPYFWRTGIYTIPEFMERRYNPAMRSLLAFCWLVFMACNLGIMLLASAKMMAALFNWHDLDALLGRDRIDWMLNDLFGSSQTAFIWMTAGLVGVYTCAGGLAAVVYTDVIQCAVMIGGCLLVLVLGLWDIGGIGALADRVDELKQQNPPVAVSAEQPSTQSPGTRTALKTEDGKTTATANSTRKLALVLPVDTQTPFPWTGIFFGLAFVLSPAYWIGNQAIVQRSLGAKSDYEAKAAYIWGAVLKNVIPFIIVLPGLIALAKFPELKDGDQAVPMLVGVLLPTGLRGLFLAAFIAALMSSIDSYLNSAATILTNDLYKRFLVKGADDRHLLRVGRLTTFGLVLWAILFALLLTRLSDKSGIYVIFQTLMAFFQGPALAVLLGGLLWKRATGIAAVVSFVVGVAFSVLLFALSQPAVYTIWGLEPLFQIADPFLYFSIWAFLLSLTLLVVISLLTRPEPEEKVAQLVYHRRRTTA